MPGTINRFVFALPAPDHRVYVGLTDEDAPGEIPDVPSATDAEIDFLLDTINSALREPLTRADMLGTYSGLRPLLDTGGSSTADISRKHAVLTSTGRDGHDRRRQAHHLPPDGRGRRRRGARCKRYDGRQVRDHATCLLVGVGAAPERLPTHIVRRYGAEAAEVVAAAGGDGALLQPVADGVDTTAAEFRFAVSHELALDESDLLERRTRVALDPVAADQARPAATAALHH